MLDPSELGALPAEDSRLVRVKHDRVRLARIRSIFRFSRGTQRLWITSRLETRTSTGTPTGMWISFAVRIARPR